MSSRGVSTVELAAALLVAVVVALLGGDQLAALGSALLVVAAVALRHAPRARRRIWSAGWLVLGTLGAWAFLVWSFWLPRDERRALWIGLDALRARKNGKPGPGDALGSRITADRSPGGSRSPADRT